MPLMIAENLRKQYGSMVAVDGVSLTIERGQCIAILGSNGAGKTTTVEMMEGLIKPTAGRIQIDGKGYDHNPREIKQVIGVMLQETSLYKRMTVRETLGLFASFFTNARSAEEIVHQFHLDEKIDAQLRTLSGGQRQRVFLACALINNPRLLFLDEPTTGLDPAARRFVWDIVREHKLAGNGIVLTTHYMEEAEVLADTVCLMANGKIIAEGSPKSLVQSEIGAAVIDVHAGRALTAVHERITKMVPPDRLRIGDCSLEIFCASDETAWDMVNDIRGYARSESIEIDRVSVRAANLEDVFLKMTGRGLSDA